MKWLKKRWKLLTALIILLPILLFGLATTLLYLQQERLVQFYLEEFNEDIHGHLVIEKSKIAPFKNFPYISIDLQGVQMFEDENHLTGTPLLELHDVYVGFDLWKLIAGKTEIKSISLNDGHIDIIQSKEAELNITKAFAFKKPSEEIAEAFHLDLKKIQIEKVDIQKLNEENMFNIVAFVENGDIALKMNDHNMILDTHADFIFTVERNGDSTFFKNKHCSIDTELAFEFDNLLMDFEPSSFQVEKAKFNFEGTIDLKNEADLNLKLKGEKPNFDLFLSFVPEELNPTLERYANAGNVFFDAEVKGKSLNSIPHVEANFGCKETYIANQFNKARVDQLQFNAYFTTGDSNTLETMHFSLKDFAAVPEAGKFKGQLSITNFASPDIDLQLDSDFNLQFLTKFFELDNIYKLSGQVLLKMNFHDIIDLNNPEKALDKLNQTYFAKLNINRLSFESPDFHLPIKDITIACETRNNNLMLDKIDLQIGKSDLHLKGKLTNIKEILHHTHENVELDLSLNSKILDLKDLTQSKRNPEQFIDDRIDHFKTHFKFIGSAKGLTEYKNLPNGTFILDELFAEFKNYPHKLHDFDVSIGIDDEQITVNKFHGEIDQSDIDLKAQVKNYALFLKDQLNGDTEIDFDIHSKKLILKDLLSYNGVNFMPKDYRHEEIDDLSLVGKAALYFKNNTVHSYDVYLNQLNGKMKIHPLKFENFKGHAHLEDEHVVLKSFGGKMGHSQFTCYLNYYYGNDPKIKKRDNYLKISASRLDIDELTNYQPLKTNEPVQHDSVFNIYELPFTDMRFDVQIGLLNYHQYQIKNVATKLHTTPEHYIYIDQMDLDVADGHLRGKGYFDGRKANKIYLNPDFSFSNMDLTKLMFKFDNFGQDELVSENLTGRISGKLSGKIRMHTDLVPIIEESSLKLDLSVYNGVIIGYAPFLALEDYFKDKNLHRIAFDTLQNSISLENGMMTIPSMAINTSLGYLLLEGRQDMDLNMDYLVRVPFKMVTKAAAQRLFKKKKEEIDPEKEDEIISYDPDKKTTFIHIRLTGNPDEYKVSIERKKKK